LFLCCIADEADPEFECPVCLQTASFPVRLPCSHIFCFLCVKGVANRSKRCALCRQDIPVDFFRDPKLICAEEVQEKSLHIFDEGYQWFYEGRRGWWQYDDRTSRELEVRYKKGEKTFELLIAGFLYIIDLENMRQIRRNDQTRRRRIRRDLRSIPDIKGIAGLKYLEQRVERMGGDGGDHDGRSAPPLAPQSGAGHPLARVHDDSYLTPTAPNNTPQTPMTPADSQPTSLSGSQENLAADLQTLNINSDRHFSGHYGHPDEDYVSDDDEDDFHGHNLVPIEFLRNELRRSFQNQQDGASNDDPVFFYNGRCIGPRSQFLRLLGCPPSHQGNGGPQDGPRNDDNDEGTSVDDGLPLQTSPRAHHQDNASPRSQTQADASLSQTQTDSSPMVHLQEDLSPRALPQTDLSHQTQQHDNASPRPQPQDNATHGIQSLADTSPRAQMHVNASSRSPAQDDMNPSQTRVHTTHMIQEPSDTSPYMQSGYTSSPVTLPHSDTDPRVDDTSTTV